MKKQEMQGPIIATILLIALIIFGLWFIFYKPKFDSNFTLPTTPPPGEMMASTSPVVDN